MRIATVGVVTDRQTEGHTATGDFIICPLLCYSNGTDNYAFVVLFCINPCPGNGFFAMFTGNGGGGVKNTPQAYLEF